MYEHCLIMKRSVHIINLDPASEDFNYRPIIDIKKLISVDDTSKELNLGPNGGLIFCMEFLLNNINWLEDQIGDYNDDYLIIDCPGQIELFIHLPIMHTLCQKLENWHYKTCGVYLIDSLFITDATRFLSGVMTCISSMIRLEIPHINILSKCDLLGDNKSEWEQKLLHYLDPQPRLILNDVLIEMHPRYEALTMSIAELIENHSMVSFIPLASDDPDKLELVLAHIDQATQFNEEELSIKNEVILTTKI